MKNYLLNLLFFVAFSALSVSCNEDDVDNPLFYNLSVTATDGGKALLEKYSETSADIIAESEITVLAVPDEGSVFIGWFVPGADTPVSNSERYTFVLKGDLSLIAMFEGIGGTSAQVVDLGLSVKWSSCNVGADSPEECGAYYAWGETKKKENYSWESYDWCDGDARYMTKYCTHQFYGDVDNIITLEQLDDIASMEWGEGWRMPTREEQDELLTSCVWKWAVYNGTYGYKVAGPNGNSIFLPATGYREGTKLYNLGTEGFYWSGSLDCDNNSNAYYMVLNGESYGWGRSCDRSVGLCVRPVCE